MLPRTDVSDRMFRELTASIVRVFHPSDKTLVAVTTINVESRKSDDNIKVDLSEDLSFRQGRERFWSNTRRVTAAPSSLSFAHIRRDTTLGLT